MSGIQLGAGHVVRGTSLLAMACIVSIGCMGGLKKQWNPRVGGFTYDEAVKEMGPPDKKETTSDGVLVAEWVTHRPQVYGSPAMGMGMGWGWRGRWGWAGTDIHSTPERAMRLQFGPDKRLQMWKEVVR